jgi:hypothetical protein
MADAAPTEAPKEDELKLGGEFPADSRWPEGSKWKWNSAGLVTNGGKQVPASMDIVYPDGSYVVRRRATKVGDSFKFTTEFQVLKGAYAGEPWRAVSNDGHRFDKLFEQVQDAFAKQIPPEVKPAAEEAAAKAAAHAVPATVVPAAPATVAPATPAPAAPAPESEAGKPSKPKAAPLELHPALKPHTDEVVPFEGGSLNLKRDARGRLVIDKNGKQVVSTDKGTTVDEMLSGPKRDAALEKLDQLICDPKTSVKARKNYQIMRERLDQLEAAVRENPEALAPTGGHRGDHRKMGAEAAAGGQPVVKGPASSRPLPPEGARRAVLEEAPNPLEEAGNAFGDFLGGVFGGGLHGLRRAGVVVERGEGGHSQSWPHGGQGGGHFGGFRGRGWGGGRGGPESL